jgi:hypothetical protein
VSHTPTLGVRKQFLIVNNVPILGFVKKGGDKFHDCESFNDITATVACKEVPGLATFETTVPTATTTTTIPAEGKSLQPFN